MTTTDARKRRTPPTEPRDQETTVNQPPFDRAELDSQRLRDIRDTLTDIRGVVADSAKMHRYTVDRLDDIHFEARQRTNLLAEIRDALKPTRPRITCMTCGTDLAEGDLLDCAAHLTDLADSEPVDRLEGWERELIGVQRDPDLTCGCGRAMPCRHCEPVGLSEPHSTFTEGSVNASADVDPDEAHLRDLKDEANCAWAEYRNDYGVGPDPSEMVAAHRAFHFAWREGRERAEKAEAAMRDEVTEHDKSRAAVLRLTRERDALRWEVEQHADGARRATNERDDLRARVDDLIRERGAAIERHRALRADVWVDFGIRVAAVSDAARAILARDDVRARS